MNSWLNPTFETLDKGKKLQYASLSVFDWKLLKQSLLEDKSDFIEKKLVGLLTAGVMRGCEHKESY